MMAQAKIGDLLANRPVLLDPDMDRRRHADHRVPGTARGMEEYPRTIGGPVRHENPIVRQQRAGLVPVDHHLVGDKKYVVAASDFGHRGKQSGQIQ